MTELEGYRRQIDAIDAQLVELFLRRMEVTGAVGRYKQERGLPVLDAERERRVIAGKTEQIGDTARRADVAALYETIMGRSRRQQRQLVREAAAPGVTACAAAMACARQPVEHPRVAYQGEPGCYSEEAAAGLFGPEVDSMGLPWFEEVFLALRDGRADYAVLPIENSSTGSIRQVYDLLAQYEYYIVGEWQVKVEHCLTALPGVKLEELCTVYSHEQGLMQCEAFWTPTGTGSECPPWTPPVPPNRWPRPETAPPPPFAPAGPRGATGWRSWPRGSTTTARTIPALCWSPR